MRDLKIDRKRFFTSIYSSLSTARCLDRCRCEGGVGGGPRGRSRRDGVLEALLSRPRTEMASYGVIICCHHMVSSFGSRCPSGVRNRGAHQRLRRGGGDVLGLRVQWIGISLRREGALHRRAYLRAWAIHLSQISISRFRTLSVTRSHSHNDNHIELEY